MCVLSLSYYESDVTMIH